MEEGSRAACDRVSGGLARARLLGDETLTASGSTKPIATILTDSMYRSQISLGKTRAKRARDVVPSTTRIWIVAQ